jgi:hypothetical protein
VNVAGTIGTCRVATMSNSLLIELRVMHHRQEGRSNALIFSREKSVSEVFDQRIALHFG